MYVLVIISILTANTATVLVDSTHPSMIECFDARDSVLVEGKHWNGFFPLGKQVVCIPIDKQKNI